MISALDTSEVPMEGIFARGAFHGIATIQAMDEHPTMITLPVHSPFRVVGRWGQHSQPLHLIQMRIIIKAIFLRFVLMGTAETDFGEAEVAWEELVRLGGHLAV